MRKKSHHPTQDTSSPNEYGENGVQHIRFRKKPGTEKEAGLVLSILVRLPVASAAAPVLAGLHSAVVLSASLLPAHINQGSGGRKEVWAGRSRGLGLRCQRPPLLEVGRGRFMVLFVCSSSGQALHLTVPLSLSCH